MDRSPLRNQLGPQHLDAHGVDRAVVLLLLLRGIHRVDLRFHIRAPGSLGRFDLRHRRRTRSRRPCQQFSKGAAHLLLGAPELGNSTLIHRGLRQRSRPARRLFLPNRSLSRGR